MTTSNPHIKNKPYDLDSADPYIISNTDAGVLQIHQERTIVVSFTPKDNIRTRQVIYEEGGDERGLNIYIQDGCVHVAGWNLPQTESNWQGTVISGFIFLDKSYTVHLVLQGTDKITPEAFKVYLTTTISGDPKSGTTNDLLAIGKGSQLWPHPDGVGVGNVINSTIFFDTVFPSSNAPSSLKSKVSQGGDFPFLGNVDQVKIDNSALALTDSVEELHTHWVSPIPLSTHYDDTIVVKTNAAIHHDRYVGEFYLGHQKKLTYLTLDTGSSTMAVGTTRYNPYNDSAAKLTDFFIDQQYVDGTSWIGSLVNSTLTLSRDSHPVTMTDFNFAVKIEPNHDHYHAYGHGIVGLAYPYWTKHDYKKMVDPRLPYDKTIDPPNNYETIFEERDRYTKTVYQSMVDQVFAKKQILTNKFALYTLRSRTYYPSGVSSKKDQAHFEGLLKSPINSGYFILGNAEKYTELYTGPFHMVNLMAYNEYKFNVESVYINHPVVNTAGGSTIATNNVPISIDSQNSGNTIIDSGTPVLIFPEAHFTLLKAQFTTAQQNAIDQESPHLSDEPWPDLIFTLKDTDNKDFTLALTPDTYWQEKESGYSFRIFGSTKRSTVMFGLSSMTNFFMVFDRSNFNKDQKKYGVVKFAKVKKPAAYSMVSQIPYNSTP